jgi:L-seryl-tRNA(Ser) seleniumtransferase
LADRGIEAHVQEVAASAGGGALADRPLPSAAAVVHTDDPDGLARRLRRGEPCVLPRIRDGQLLLDGRTVLPDEDDLLLDAVTAAVRGG